jgi:hypothetical protein
MLKAVCFFKNFSNEDNSKILTAFFRSLNYKF